MLDDFIERLRARAADTADSREAMDLLNAADIVLAAANYTTHYFKHDQESDWDHFRNLNAFRLTMAVTAAVAQFRK